MKRNSSASVISISRAKELAEKREIKQYHPILGLRWYLTVDGAAYRLNCSTRRVRQLLQSHRLVGYKAGKDWVIKYPLMVQIGKRGPKANVFTASNRGQISDLCI
ncbi:MAG: hypothetical protein Q8L73_11805 [Methylotenera sp.]|nr:hypothetical protein [Methylotenera sp.]